MKKIFYEKVGRRYKPVYEYDSTLLDALPKGNHLISVYPGGSSRRYNIDPALAPMIAAGRVAEDAICEALRTAQDLRPKQTPITEQQRLAWQKLARAFGDEIHTLTIPSARDAADAAVKAMMLEAEKLMKHDAVRLAFEQFIMVCELCKESEKENVQS